MCVSAPFSTVPARDSTRGWPAIPRGEGRPPVVEPSPGVARPLERRHTGVPLEHHFPAPIRREVGAHPGTQAPGPVMWPGAAGVSGPGPPGGGLSAAAGPSATDARLRGRKGAPQQLLSADARRRGQVQVTTNASTHPNADSRWHAALRETLRQPEQSFVCLPALLCSPYVLTAHDMTRVRGGVVGRGSLERPPLASDKDGVAEYRQLHCSLPAFPASLTGKLSPIV